MATKGRRLFWYRRAGVGDVIAGVGHGRRRQQAEGKEKRHCVGRGREWGAKRKAKKKAESEVRVKKEESDSDSGHFRPRRRGSRPYRCSAAVQGNAPPVPPQETCLRATAENEFKCAYNEVQSSLLPEMMGVAEAEAPLVSEAPVLAVHPNGSSSATIEKAAYEITKRGFSLAEATVKALGEADHFRFRWHL